jgi:hypothetical protein
MLKPDNHTKSVITSWALEMLEEELQHKWFKLNKQTQESSGADVEDLDDLKAQADSTVQALVYIREWHTKLQADSGLSEPSDSNRQLLGHLERVL